ncbi:MFS transporter [Acinetobacter gerneri]|uniref:MFS transporter n=1 Tax=Acinetobacter gerneri TaxID=202952 RepID=A0AAW8JK33_9GAMM|nr:MFS transporter [Acinetobacter gerneri]MDQ9010679.1 MFS transporter [Acinetobacter gerneri]MDQ9014889.1 MFS transporter [Acinetobacter gerneri]MDQ9026049.1 MFS transporter [Acinetobacter gerneri]MDQ9053341.1 MFS transporter [Acinetobacter gerneri]MDQ9060960.1 MFS transporter [Acinetobacter gerneri]
MDKQQYSSSPCSSESTDHMPLFKLLAFTMAGFLTIMTETMPAGLLPQISQGLQISQAQAGQLISIFAFGSAVAAIPIIYLTQSWNRRPLFLMAIAGLFIFNSLTALSNHYWLTLIVRFVGGMCAGIIWGLLAGYARRLVPTHLQGRALAIAGVGQPIALSLGVPLGAWLGQYFVWQNIFLIISVLSFILLFWIQFGIPDFAGQARQKQLPIHRVFLIAGIPSILITLFCWILAHNILYTYIAAFLNTVGLIHQLDLALMIVGISSFIGIWFIGINIDRKLRNLTLFSLVLFALSLLVLTFAKSSPFLIFASIAFWGMSFGGAPTLLQTALADTAGENADIAQSMLVTVFNFAIACGGFVGGYLLEHYGAEIFPSSMLIFILFSLVIVYLGKKHAFKIGHRPSKQH